MILYAIVVPWTTGDLFDRVMIESCSDKTFVGREWVLDGKVPDERSCPEYARYDEDYRKSLLVKFDPQDQFCHVVDLSKITELKEAA